MKTNVLAVAADLTDHDLLARLTALARSEREVTVELVAHLAALEMRPAAYAAEGYGSLFAYCTRALHFSEDAACSRIAAAKACRRFPVILERLASGEMTLTAVRMLAPHLTDENHETALEQAKGMTLGGIEGLVAALAPRPDAPSLVRRLPRPAPVGTGLSVGTHTVTADTVTADTAATGIAAPGAAATDATPHATADATTAETASNEPTPLRPQPAPRPVVKPTAPERYRVQFTIGEKTHEKLRRLQALLRREIPDGDPGVLFDRALTLLLEQVENTKLGVTAHPRSSASSAIRFETDRAIRTPVVPSRYVSRSVRRAVWIRDAGQCTFVSATGRRCGERSFLEFHHVEAYAKHGLATVDNIALRCSRHNQYEAEREFGARGRSNSASPSP
jgi:hypothetical protein